MFNPHERETRSKIACASRTVISTLVVPFLDRPRHNLPEDRIYHLVWTGIWLGANTLRMSFYYFALQGFLHHPPDRVEAGMGMLLQGLIGVTYFGVGTFL